MQEALKSNLFFASNKYVKMVEYLKTNKKNLHIMYDQFGSDKDTPNDASQSILYPSFVLTM